MRLPLAPSKPPATDTVGMDSVFSIVTMLRATGRDSGPQVHQKMASELATERKWDDPSILVENMVGGFAQRCDHLIADIEAVRVAPMLFDPMWPIVVLAAGTRNEEWMGFWSHMRIKKEQS